MLRTVGEKLQDQGLVIQSGSPVSSDTESVDQESPRLESDTESSSTTQSSEQTEPDISDFLGPDTQSTSFDPKLKTYKLIGDNIDKNIQPREMRMDNQTRSLHYFSTYGIRARIDLSAFSSEIKVCLFHVCICQH